MKGADDHGRHPKMRALINKAGAQLYPPPFYRYRRSHRRALRQPRWSISKTAASCKTAPSRNRPCPDATLDDLDAEAVTAFVRRATANASFHCPKALPPADVLDPS